MEHKTDNANLLLAPFTAVHVVPCRERRAIMQLLRAYKADTATFPDSAEKAD